MEEAVSTRTLDELQLSAAELLELRGGSDRPVTVQFFAALDKAQRAHQRCRQLLQVPPHCWIQLGRFSLAFTRHQ